MIAESCVRILLSKEGHVQHVEAYDEAYRVDKGDVLDAAGLDVQSLAVLLRSLAVLQEVTDLPVLWNAGPGGRSNLRMDARSRGDGVEIVLRPGRAAEQSDATVLHESWWPRAIIDAANTSRLGLALNVWTGDIWRLDWMNEAGKAILCLDPEEEPEVFPPGVNAWGRDEWVDRNGRAAWHGNLKWTLGEEQLFLDVAATQEMHLGRQCLVVIFRDVTRMEEAESALRATLARLERSNAELDQLGTVLAHDLREPVASLTGLVRELHARCDPNDATAKQLADAAEHTSKHLDAMLQGLFECARVAGEDLREPVDLNETLRSVRANLADAVTRVGAELVVDEMPTLRAHPMRMEQLFLNLIQNALRHPQDDVPLRVHVRVRKAKDGWNIRVQDNGVGFDPEQAEDLFRIYHTSGDGLGIGLALCKRIVEAHDGTIHATSKGGATFHIHLPS